MRPVVGFRHRVPPAARGCGRGWPRCGFPFASLRSRPSGPAAFRRTARAAARSVGFPFTLCAPAAARGRRVRFASPSPSPRRDQLSFACQGCGSPIAKPIALDKQKTLSLRRWRRLSAGRPKRSRKHRRSRKPRPPNASHSRGRNRREIEVKNSDLRSHHGFKNALRYRTHGRMLDVRRCHF